MAALPALAIYSLLGIAAVLENCFPPVPSDVMVALAAFLARRGTTTALGVFGVAWISSICGAGLIYWLARDYGRAFFAGPIGRRLLPPSAIALMEREYLRFGLAGIFVTRLLPGFRSFVAPFAGLVGLHPAKALVSMALASGLWYGSLVWIGVSLGESWDTISRVVAHLNLGLGIAAGLALVLVIALVLKNRLRSRQDRLWSAVHRAFEHDAETEREARTDPATLAAAALLLELARADRALTRDDVRFIESHLRGRWELGPAAPAARPDRAGRLPRDTGQFRGRITARYDRESRASLLRRLRQVVCGDQQLSPHQDRLLHRAADLLGLASEDFETLEKSAAP